MLACLWRTQMKLWIRKSWIFLIKTILNFPTTWFKHQSPHRNIQCTLMFLSWISQLISCIPLVCLSSILKSILCRGNLQLRSGHNGDGGGANLKILRICSPLTSSPLCRGAKLAWNMNGIYVPICTAPTHK